MTPSTFGPACSVQDVPRIMRQMDVIRDLMLVGHVFSATENEWMTLAEIEQATGYPQASISAQLRHLRKPAFGSYQVPKRRRYLWYPDCPDPISNTWEYRLLPPVKGQGEMFEEER